jgi:hypothetical protein
LALTHQAQDAKAITSGYHHIEHDHIEGSRFNPVSLIAVVQHVRRETFGEGPYE